MKSQRILPIFGLMAGLICSPAFADDVVTPPPHVPLQKTIGQTSKPEVVPSLIVLNSKGASLNDGKLVLSGIAPNSIIFADRPVRAAGHELTKHVVEDWGQGPDSFADNPPNATVSGFSREGDVVTDAVIVLQSPKLDGDTLTFDVEVLEGNLSGADGGAAVFIDLIGRPLTPRSFAGMGRRMGRRAFRRGAYYAGAAAAGAAAAYGAYAPRCGYYPYPPCY
jgi:hypothetical protein